ncbi:hypothetical protein [Arsenicicoccus dermatophilus]|uniref:hypothetical protein n=1 Tax=Arsenicicoccus dermatophilus TaxID=1076331 RepID=UPI0039174FB7
MADLVLNLRIPLPRELVRERLWCADRHTEEIPLTTVSTSGNGRLDQVGAEILARTGWWPLAVDDRMLVLDVSCPEDGPWRYRIVKIGTVVRGSVDATLVPAEAGAATDLVWRQRVSVIGVPRWADPLTAAVARMAYASAIRRICLRPDRALR